MKINRFSRNTRILIFSALLFCGASTSGWAATYYVDSNRGKDGNPGTQAKPWRSVAKVSSTALKAGDVVNFKSGDSWDDILYPASGTNGRPITYGANGS